MLKKAFAGMGDPDEAACRRDAEDEGTVTAGRYGAPLVRPIAGKSVHDGEEDSGADDDSTNSGGTARKPPTTATATTISHPGMYSERDPILKGAASGSVSNRGAYDGPLVRASPQAGLKASAWIS